MIGVDLQREDGSNLFATLEGEAFAIRDGGQNLGPLSPEATVDVVCSAIRGGLRRMTVELEDGIFVFPPSRVTNNHGTEFLVVSFDKVHGDSHSCYLTLDKIALIVKAGLLGTDDGPDYHAAAAVVKDWPSNLRLVP